MTVLLVLIPLGLGLLVLAIAAFVWAAKHGQFEDLDAEGSRILFDEQPAGGRAKSKDLEEKQTPR